MAKLLGVKSKLDVTPVEAGKKHIAKSIILSI